MSEITRYNLASAGTGAGMDKHDNGPFVLYSDHEAEVDRLQERLFIAPSPGEMKAHEQHWENKYARLFEEVADLQREIERLQEESRHHAINRLRLAADLTGVREAYRATMILCERFREALANIVESRDVASELYTSDREMANSFADKARAALFAPVFDVGDPDEAAEMSRKPPCRGCGRPHLFDTSIPSDQWNVVVRVAGLPDYLCFICIVKAFAKAREPFTGKLFSDLFPTVHILVAPERSKTLEAVGGANNAQAERHSHTSSDSEDIAAILKAAKDYAARKITSDQMVSIISKHSRRIVSEQPDKPSAD